MIEAADLQRLVQRLQAENVTSFDCAGPDAPPALWSAWCGEPVRRP